MDKADPISGSGEAAAPASTLMQLVQTVDASASVLLEKEQLFAQAQTAAEDAARVRDEAKLVAGKAKDALKAALELVLPNDRVRISS